MKNLPRRVDKNENCSNAMKKVENSSLTVGASSGLRIDGAGRMSCPWRTFAWAKSQQPCASPILFQPGLEHQDRPKRLRGVLCAGDVRAPPALYECWVEESIDSQLARFEQVLRP